MGLDLFGEEAASWRVGPASIWSARCRKLHYKICLRCCQLLYQAIVMSFCFCVSGHVWLGSPGKYVGKNFPCLRHIWITHIDTDVGRYTQRNPRTYSFLSNPIPSQTPRLIFTSHHITLNSSEYFTKQMMPLVHFVSHLQMSLGTIFTGLTDPSHC